MLLYSDYGSVLEAVSTSKSVWKARPRSQYKIESFNRYLKQIRALEINPVTIPVGWNINYLENINTFQKGGI